MPSVKITSYYLQHALATYGALPEHLNKLLKTWNQALAQAHQELSAHFQQHPETTVKAELVEPLRRILSEEIQEEDVRLVIGRTYLLFFLVSEKEQSSLAQTEGLSWLGSLHQQLQAASARLPALQHLRTVFEQLSSLLPDSGYQLIKTLFQTPARPLTALSEQAMEQLSALFRELTFPASPAQPILWISPWETDWPPLLGQVQQDVMIIHTDPVAYALQQLRQHQHPGRVIAHWLDPLRVQPGAQAYLFAPTSDTDQALSKVQNTSFSSVGLDFRAAPPAFHYPRRSYRYWEQQLASWFTSEEALVPARREMLLYWAMQKSSETAWLILLLPRPLLYQQEEAPFRQLLSRLSTKIYVLDFRAESEEGTAVMFLRKRAEGDSSLSEVLYRATGTDQPGAGGSSWWPVNLQQQNHWMGLPESDFFSLYPLFGSSDRLFSQASPPNQCLMPQWLMDDDSALLQKKVKFLLKEYRRLSSEKNSKAAIRWTADVRQLAEEEVKINFDSGKIQRIMLSPFVWTYVYAEEKLMTQPLEKQAAIVTRPGRGEVLATDALVSDQWMSEMLIFHKQGEEGFNVTDRALRTFRKFYEDQTKKLDNRFIVFPPEQVTQTLEKISEVSQDLPVIRKYPQQINQLLEDARHFTSDVELLAPPYQKIEEFRRKVQRLERDAIERKGIYQRVNAYIEELKEQLAALTYEHDECRKDLEAVSQENLFYYAYAVLSDPAYARKYADHLRWELPRLPRYPHFRKWVEWGKALFACHSLQDTSLKYALLEVETETLERRVARIRYDLNEEKQSLEIQEEQVGLVINKLPRACWQIRIDGLNPIEHYLQHLSRAPVREADLKEKFNPPRLSNPEEVVRRVEVLCALSVKSASIYAEMQQAHKP